VKGPHRVRDRVLSFISESSGGVTLAYISRGVAEAQSHARSAQAEGGIEILQSHRVVGESLLRGAHRVNIVDNWRLSQSRAKCARRDSLNLEANKET
jgi:hypothetical protein